MQERRTRCLHMAQENIEHAALSVTTACEGVARVRPAAMLMHDCS